MFAPFRTHKAMFLSLVLSTGLGCADVADDVEATETSSPAAEPLAQTANTRTKSVPDPKGLYIANVTALGTGCPVGSWDVSIAPDGQVFTMTFASYEIKLSEADRSATKSLDCDITVELKSPAGLSYAINSFYYAGYAFLEDGVTANIAANYYFDGLASARTRAANKTFKGPFDDSYVFKDEVTTLDWSPCGTTRALNITTSLTGKNAAKKKNGYLNMASLDGETKTQYTLVMKLSNRRCSSTSR